MLDLHFSFALIYSFLYGFFLWLWLILMNIFHKRIRIILNSFLFSLIFVVIAIPSNLLMENLTNKIFENYCYSRNLENVSIYSARLLTIDCTRKLDFFVSLILTAIIGVLLVNLDKIIRTKWLKDHYTRLE